MRAGGIGELRKAAAGIRRRFGAKALILLYHRVINLSADPHLLCVTPQHFAEHLEVLRHRYRVIPLKHLTQALANGNLPPRSVVVTFDDGYADNLQNAKPLLERYDIPATVFVSTGYIERKREFWWDELERLLLQPGLLPQMLRLPVGGICRQWQLGEAAEYDEHSYRLHCAWNIERADPGPRQQLFREIYQVLHPLPPGEQEQVLDRLRQCAGAEPSYRPTHRTLWRDEVVSLANGGLVDVGAHTVTHPILADMSVAIQREEVRRSKEDLEQILGNSVTSFAYPYGLRSTYTHETVAAVREASFACACSNFPDVVGRSTDKFQLPRLVIQDCDGDTFSRVLRYWLGD